MKYFTENNREEMEDFLLEKSKELCAQVFDYVNEPFYGGSKYVVYEDIDGIGIIADIIEDDTVFDTNTWFYDDFIN